MSETLETKDYQALVAAFQVKLREALKKEEGKEEEIQKALAEMYEKMGYSPPVKLK